MMLERLMRNDDIPNRTPRLIFVDYLDKVQIQRSTNWYDPLHPWQCASRNPSLMRSCGGGSRKYNPWIRRWWNEWGNAAFLEGGWFFSCRLISDWISETAPLSRTRDIQSILKERQSVIMKTYIIMREKNVIDTDSYFLARLRVYTMQSTYWDCKMLYVRDLTRGSRRKSRRNRI